jgi:hypothetical protein
MKNIFCAQHQHQTSRIASRKQNAARISEIIGIRASKKKTTKRKESAKK